MITVEQLIGDLLLRHNCVIVPSFGGFVAQKIPAKIDFEKGTMIPPSKSVMFNRQLVNNDGLLVNEYAQINRKSFIESTSSISESVSEWKLALKKGERIEIDRVGRLYMDDENTIRFEQDRFFNLLLESFGLGHVQFISEVEEEEIVEAIAEELEVAPLHVLQPAKEISVTKPVKESEQVEADPKVVPLQPSKRRVWKYVAAACILPIAFYSIWIPMKTDVLESGMISIKDFNPFYNSSPGNYSQHDFSERISLELSTDPTLEEQLEGVSPETKVFAYDFGDDTYVHIRLKEESTSSISKTELPSANSDGFSANKLHFIVGCFGNEMNAKNLVIRLKEQGLDAEIVDIRNGLHRVSAGGAISMEALRTIENRAESLGFQGWVLK